MDDLISRSTVIDVLKETGIIQDNDLGHLVVDEIERIPVAYNVKKVVEELESRCNIYKGSSDGYDSGKYYAYDDSIEIVRKGGVE